MLPYFVPTDLITKHEISYLESQITPDAQFIAYDTVSGKKDGNLCWDNNIELFNCFNLSSYNFFVHQQPHTDVTPHIDNPKWKRNTVLLVPLFYTNAYAPCYFKNGPKVTHETPILFNTQIEHYIHNNEHARYNFQICFEESIEEVAKCLTRI